MMRSIRVHQLCMFADFVLVASLRADIVALELGGSIVAFAVDVGCTCGSGSGEEG